MLPTFRAIADGFPRVATESGGVLPPRFRGCRARDPDWAASTQVPLKDARTGDQARNENANGQNLEDDSEGTADTVTEERLRAPIGFTNGCSTQYRIRCYRFT